MKCARPRLGMYMPGTGTGGPWRYVHSILAAIDLNEFDVRLFCDIQGVYEPRPEVRVVPINSVPTGAPSSAAPAKSRRRAIGRSVLPGIVRLWIGFGRQAARLAEVFRRSPVDLLHTNCVGCEESPVAIRLAGISQALGTFHVDSTYDLRQERSGFGHRLVEHLSNHCLKMAIGVSRKTSEDWISRTHLSARRIVTIHNGINPDQFQRRTDRGKARQLLGLPADGRLIIGGVGRLEEAKGFTYLLDAVAQLSPEYPTLSLVLAGQGPLLEPLKAQAARLGIAERVHFTGFCRDVQQVYDALDIFVLSSLCEALPYALLEAMATCLPTVGTTAGGVPEVIVPGRTGSLVSPRSGEALASALRPLLASADMRETFGQAGRQRVLAHFSEEKMVQETIQVYRDLLKMRS